MLEEDTVSPANRPFPVAERIVSDTDSRTGVHIFVLHAAGFHAFGAALDNAIEQAPRVGVQKLRIIGIVISEILRSIGQRIILYAEAIFLIELLLIPPIDTPAQAKVHGQFLANPPVILEEWFENLVTIVKKRLSGSLRISPHLSCQQVGKRISCGVGSVYAERQVSLRVQACLL